MYQKWENATIDARLHLPSQNVFLPSDFKLISPETGVSHVLPYHNFWKSSFHFQSFELSSCSFIHANVKG